MSEIEGGWMGHTYSVWVYFQRDLTICLANVLVGCVGREAEQVVGVYLWIAGHVGSD
jgi:hypothetical protein